MNLISKQQAITINQKWYFTGISCKNGHIDKRYCNTNVCYECKRLNIKKDYSKNPKRIKETNNKSNRKNKERVSKTSKKWVENNREKSNNIKKNYKIKHREKHLKKAREYAKNERKDPFKRVSKNLSKAIWECLKTGKNKNSWITFVDFTIEELLLHLNSKFKQGMTWENYGSYWHVDHIKPLSWFNLETEFKHAWNLNNLQPLEAKINLSKRNRYIG